MKNFRCLLIFTMFMPLLALTANAQTAPDLVINNVIFTQADTLGNTSNVNFSLVNIGTDSFTYADHQFLFYVHEDTLTTTSPSFALTPTFQYPFSGTNGHMNIGDSLFFSIPINLTNPPFKAAASNEIVIWPRTAPGETDSLNNFTKIVFYLFDRLNAFNPSLLDKQPFRIYPSPAGINATISIESSMLKNNSQLEIINAAGQVVHQETLYPNVSNLMRSCRQIGLTEAGTYIFMLRNKSEIRIQKVVISK
jgi:hypothetical protein